MDQNAEATFGINHLSSAPITATFGITLLAVLLVLIFLRLLFADVGGTAGVSVSGRGGAR